MTLFYFSQTRDDDWIQIDSIRIRSETKVFSTISVGQMGSRDVKSSFIENEVEIIIFGDDI